jgi:glycosyltransferase involved in cell wall biosynthesis
MAMAAWRWPQPAAGAPTPGASGPILRGPIVPAEAFIALWSGPFESWCDPAALIAAMNTLMERQPSVHCVVTGRRAEGALRAPQQVFEDLLEQSSFKDRFHLLGAVEATHLEQIYREGDIGIVLDGRNYETLFGAHWRIAAMAAERLAIALTVGTELSEWLEEANAALAVPIGGRTALAEAIEPWIDQHEHLNGLGQAGHKFMVDYCNSSNLAARLLAWLKEPKLAPDNQAKLELDGQVVNDLNSVFLNELEEQTMMLMRYRPSEIQQALADWEARNQRGKSLFSFGRRRE